MRTRVLLWVGAGFEVRSPAEPGDTLVGPKPPLWWPLVMRDLALPCQMCT